MARLPDLSQQERPTPRALGGVVQLESRTGMESVPSEQTLATGREFTSLGERLQKQLDDTEADAANTAYDNQRREILFGQNGYYNMKGKDALTAMKPTGEAIEKARAQIREGLSGSEQKRLYDYMTRRSTSYELYQMSRHAVEQGNRYSLETNKAALQNRVNQAATYRYDNEKFGEILGDIATLVEQGAKLEGRTDPEYVQAQMMHWGSEAQVARIRSVATENPIAAQQLFNENANSIDVRQRVQLERELRQQVRPIQAKGIVDANLPDTVRPKDTWALYGDLKKRVEVEAERLYPGDSAFRDQADRELKAKISDIVLQQRGVQNQALRQGLAVVHGLNPEGKPTPKPLSLSQAMADPRFRAAYDALDTDGQAALERGIDMNLNRVEAMERRAEADERRRERRQRMSVDNTLQVDLANRISLPWGSPGKIYDTSALVPYYGKGIDEAGFRFLQMLVNEDQNKGSDSMKTLRNGTITSFKPQFIKDTVGGPDQFGAERFNAFHQWAIEQEERLKREGKDPRTLYNPDGPDYIGKRVNSFRPTTQQRMQRMNEEMRREAGGVGSAVSGSITGLPKLSPGSELKFDRNGKRIQ